MKIRKYQAKDKDRVVYICLRNADLEEKDFERPVAKYIKQMFCLYYIEKEPENCFVAVDENDIPFGYVYGSRDYDLYRENFDEYLAKISEISETYLADGLVEMYNHYVRKSEYPAHLHIDILEGHQNCGIGSELIKQYCENIASKGIKGVMLIVGSDNVKARAFYEKNGFSLLCEKESGASYGKKLN